MYKRTKYNRSRSKYNHCNSEDTNLQTNHSVICNQYLFLNNALL